MKELEIVLHANAKNFEEEKEKPCLKKNRITTNTEISHLPIAQVFPN
tara:strand:+ start:1183 stop:1323 length:141 start_codon:yes stop_codon:yes gene_type:complete